MRCWHRFTKCPSHSCTFVRCVPFCSIVNFRSSWSKYSFLFETSICTKSKKRIRSVLGCQNYGRRSFSSLKVLFCMNEDTRYHYLFNVAHSVVLTTLWLEPLLGTQAIGDVNCPTYSISSFHKRSSLHLLPQTKHQKPHNLLFSPPTLFKAYS